MEKPDKLKGMIDNRREYENLLAEVKQKLI